MGICLEKRFTLIVYAQGTPIDLCWDELCVARNPGAAAAFQLVSVPDNIAYDDSVH